MKSLVVSVVVFGVAAGPFSPGCDSGLQEPGEREPEEALDDGSEDFEPSEVPDTRTIPYLCDSDDMCDDDDPCTRGACNGRFCTYNTINIRLAVQTIDTAAPALLDAVLAGAHAEGEALDERRCVAHFV